MITDEELIAHLASHPRSSLAAICEALELPYSYSRLRRSPDGMDYGYTPEAKRLRQQLQRLRLRGRIRTEGQRWYAREKAS